MEFKPLYHVCFLTFIPLYLYTRVVMKVVIIDFRSVNLMKDRLYTWLWAMLAVIGWMHYAMHYPRLCFSPPEDQICGSFINWSFFSFFFFFKLKQMLRLTLACQWLTLSLLPSAKYTSSPKGKNDRHIHNAAVVSLSVAGGKKTLWTWTHLG